MSNVSFLPRRDADLLAWSLAFKTGINAEPLTVGLTVLQATHYGTTHDTFAAALAAVQNDATNSRTATLVKEQAKAALLIEARTLAAIVQAYPLTTDAQRLNLGLTVPVQRAPIPAPSQTPVLEVADRFGTTVTLRIHDGASPRRGKPDGVQGANLYSYVAPSGSAPGAQPPTDLTQWHFEGNTTRTEMEVRFPAGTAPGTVVWFTAFWYNPRAESGPGCNPLSAIIAGGGMQQAA